jgi:hypothetical protein
MKELTSVGLLIVAATSAVGQEKVADWVKVTDRAAWKARDSQGEVVYKDKMWIFGGWFDSFQPAPRDVWSSSDGRNWELVTSSAAWRSSDIPMALVFQDKMWFMGGWYNGRLAGHTATREVWWSTDGSHWERAKDAGWSPRMGAGAVVFKDKMWILGGTEDYLFARDDKPLRNDVWCSSDGQEWRLVTDKAGWSPRALHQAVVLNDKMWVLGGGNYQPTWQVRNDVWCSEDGANWTRVLENAPWQPRIWFSTVVYRDRMWVLGGSTHGNKLLVDVWYSSDGRRWIELKSRVAWSARHEHSAFVFQDKIWVAGGHARPLNSEVWSLQIPPDWFNNDEPPRR